MRSRKLYQHTGNKCHVTGKQKYKNRFSAEKARRRIYDADPSGKLEDLHGYQCEHCHFWHVGHRTGAGYD